VFTGMQRSIDERPAVRRLLARADTHSNLVIVMVRLAVIVPYLVQNLALAATGAPIWRLALMTSVSAIPGAAIYSLLGAGLVQADDVGELSLYVGLPVALLLALAGALAFFNGRQRKAASEGHSQEASS
ncbi:MAG: hypothetical protein R3305_10760, partial [Gammaproteobacteria bacterium]|nr:hypothetical protein [Gammaproteobacteria bacterium]